MVNYITSTNRTTKVAYKNQNDLKKVTKVHADFND